MKRRPPERWALPRGQGGAIANEMTESRPEARKISPKSTPKTRLTNHPSHARSAREKRIGHPLLLPRKSNRIQRPMTTSKGSIHSTIYPVISHERARLIILIINRINSEI